MANMMIERSSGLKDMLPLPKNADSAVLFVSLVSLFALSLAEMVMDKGYELDFKANSAGVEAHLKKNEDE